MKASKKIQKNLERRMHDFETCILKGKHEVKVQQRIDTGGFIRPGARKK